jgi:iron complex outermembrane recepter protein
MKLQTTRGRLLASTMIFGAMALAAPALAQTAGQQTAANNESAPTVVVTGTLFRTRTETAAPVTVLTARKIAVEGITNVTDAVRSIPADNSGTLPNAFSGAFATGASGVALRGLTVNSTLVLTDGMRNADYPIGDDGIRDFVDLNTMPLAVVDHIDVDKDGASAIYGADAIGGVVNIILKPTFEGVEGTVEGGTTQHGGGDNYHLDLTAGTGNLDNDHFNVYVSGEYDHIDPILVSDRPFPFNTYNLTSIGGVDPGDGNAQTDFGSIYGAVAPGTLAQAGNLLTGVQTGDWQVLAPGGCGPKGTLTTKPDPGAFGGTDSYCAQDLEAPGYDQSNETRYGFYARATVEFNPNTIGYVAVSYYQNNNFNVFDAPPGGAYQQIQQPSPVNTNTIALPVTLPNGSLNPNNPFASKGEVALINFAFPTPLMEQTQNHVYRGVADLHGTVSGWDYNLGLAIEHEDLDYALNGFTFFPALIADVTDGTYNFLDPTSNPASVNAALFPTIAKVSTSDLDSVDFQATHPVFDLPGGPLNFGFGLHAHYEAQDNPELNPNGDFEGLGVDHASGNRYVLSAFGELDAPVFKSLDVNLAGRFDHYSDFGNAFSPKIEVKWTPIRQFALRGTFSEGFRAPSFAEAHTGAVGGFETLNLNNPGDPIETAYFNAHGGDGYVAPYSLEAVNIDNPHIKPERSQSFTVGFVAQPAPWISASLDYYYIQKTDVIFVPSPGPALDDYLSGQPLPAGITVIADRPDPNDPTGLARPLAVEAAYNNANSLITTGLDLDVRVNFELPYDMRLVSDMNFTDILTYRYSEPGVPTFDYTGTESPYNLSSGAGTPQYRMNWTTTVTWEKLSVSATVNYVSQMLEDAADITGNTGCISSLPSNCTVGAFWDVDMNADYKLTKNVDVFLNVYNVADALPPVDEINYAGINYNPTYDEAGIIGRAFKVGVHIKY